MVAVSLEALAAQVNADIVGGPHSTDHLITQIATLDNAQEGEIAFLFDRGYYKFLNITRASAVVLKEEHAADCPVPALVVRDPYLAYAKIASVLNPLPKADGSQHPSAVIADDAEVDASVNIGPNVVIGDRVKIGANCTISAGCVIEHDVILGENSFLKPNVTLCHGVHIGKRVLIHPGAVIGSDGFGLANDQGKWVKIPQIGSVQIGDDVEIGANTSIDRGAMKDTIIAQGVKIDNQIQIAHNVRIGEHSALAGCVGIAGSATIGKHCMIGGGVGISGHLEITDGVTLTGMSLVTKSIQEPGVYSSGWPVKEARAWRKTVAQVNRLDSHKKQDK